MDEPEFRPDLYRGTARAYDRFRVPYPAALIDDLLARTGANGEGRMLDLACGTGQIGFAVRHAFDDVLAVDQEPDMIEVGRDNAQAAGVRNLRFMTSSAEDLVVPDGSVALVAIGNAFHRLRRETVAGKARSWLRPGGHLALLWSEVPWLSGSGWQQAMSATLDRWMTKLGTHDRVPPGWERARAERPDRDVLGHAGFEVIGTFDFPITYEWTPDALVGLVRSTSFLPDAVLAGHAREFEADLRRELAASDPTGRFAQEIGFAYELARAPA